jgi:hypothetical protein
MTNQHYDRITTSMAHILNGTILLKQHKHTKWAGQHYETLSTHTDDQPATTSRMQIQHWKRQQKQTRLQSTNCRLQQYNPCKNQNRTPISLKFYFWILTFRSEFATHYGSQNNCRKFHCDWPSSFLTNWPKVIIMQDKSSLCSSMIRAKTGTSHRANRDTQGQQQHKMHSTI